MDRILIVDDEKSIRQTLQAFLEKDGYEVHTAADVDKALSLVEEYNFSTIVTDIILPGLTGIDLLQKLQEQCPKVPVIMITGEPTVGTAADSVRAGAFDYLPKPIRGNDIRKIVSKAILVSRLNRDLEILEAQNKKYQVHLEELVKERTAHLQRANKQLQLLSLAVEQSPVAIIITDISGNIEFVNPKFTHNTGYTFQEVSGQNPRLLNSGYHTREFYDSLWKTIKSGETWYGQFQNKRKDGELFWESASISPVKNSSGEITHFLGVKEDISDKLNIEKKEKKIQAKLIHANKMTSLGILSSGVAHEINNPNNFIMFNSELLKNICKDSMSSLLDHQKESGPITLGGLPLDEMKEAVPKLLNGITDGAERIKQIVENLRNFSRQDIETEFGPVDLNMTIKKTISMIEYQIFRATNNFNVIYNESIPKILANDHQIGQVVLNLITNALHALLDPTYELQVSTDIEKKSEYAVVEVKDNGTGMSEEVLNHITEPFFTTKQNEGGTGLGLSISYSIIEDHNGSMTFKSKPGKGTTVTLKLPLSEKN